MQARRPSGSLLACLLPPAEAPTHLLAKSGVVSIPLLPLNLTMKSRGNVMLVVLPFRPQPSPDDWLVFTYTHGARAPRALDCARGSLESGPSPHAAPGCPPHPSPTTERRSPPPSAAHPSPRQAACWALPSRYGSPVFLPAPSNCVCFFSGTIRGKNKQNRTCCQSLWLAIHFLHLLCICLQI